MVTFRNSLLLLAVIAVMVPAANAQVGITPPMTCTANSGVPPIVRAEGLAELVGDAILQCTGGTPTALTAPVPKVNFRVFLNTTVTSRLVSSPWNEALLMIDEPAPADQRVCTLSSGCSLTGVGEEPGVDYSQADYNVWQGTAIFNNVNSSGNTIEWLGVPVDPPGTQAVRVIRITNVRVNAAERGVGGSLIPTRLTMFISATGTSSLPITNPQVDVAFIQDGLVVSADANDYLQCEAPDGYTEICFQERFATAFKRRNIATDDDNPTAMAAQDMPGTIYNTETGFWNPNLSPVNGADVAGRASQGTQLTAVFKNIPAGVDIYVAQRNLETLGNHATLVTGGVPLSWNSATGESQVSLSGGAGAATWEVIEDNPVSVDELCFQIRIDYTPNTSAGIPALGVGSLAGSYAPVSDLIVATSTDLQPRFIDDSEDIDFLTINSCATNLLWPYVTNQAGFDTGLVISNTSMDPFGTVTQEGVCEIYYYGNSNGGDPPSMDTTPVVGAGGYAIWTLSSGGGVKLWGEGLSGVIAAAPGFEGYVIAHCMFQYAHGYGFISDLGAQKLSQGYLALILDESIWCSGYMDSKDGSCGSRTGSKSEKLDQ